MIASMESLVSSMVIFREQLPRLSSSAMSSIIPIASPEVSQANVATDLKQHHVCAEPKKASGRGLPQLSHGLNLQIDWCFLANQKWLR
jgi:hypothetical protein